MAAETVGRRVNTTPRIINKHYDLPTKREQFENRGREHLNKLGFDSKENE